MTPQEEKLLVQQVLKKRAEDPSYLPADEEERKIVAFWMTWQLLLYESTTMQPDKPPRGRITITFDAQTRYVQKRILRHELELRLALAHLEELSDLDLNIVLEECGLRGDVVLPNVVRHCLTELEEERFNRLMEWRFLNPSWKEDISQFDYFAPTIAMQAEELGLEIVEPNKQRGQYMGPVVGVDHRAALLKFCQGKAIEIPFLELLENQSRPKPGDMLLVKFKVGEMLVSVTD